MSTQVKSQSKAKVIQINVQKLHRYMTLLKSCDSFSARFAYSTIMQKTRHMSNRHTNELSLTQAQILDIIELLRICMDNPGGDDYDEDPDWFNNLSYRQFLRNNRYFAIYAGFQLFLLKYVEPITSMKYPNVRTTLNLMDSILMKLNGYVKQADEFGDANIVSGVEQIKDQLGKFIIELELTLPEEMMLDLLRSERIIRILKVEQALEDKVSPAINQVICNSDLNRYLIGFID